MQSAATGGAERHSWTQPGVLRIAIQNGPNTLNPILSGNTTEGLLNRLSFDVLVSVSADGKTPVPVLAQTVPTLENGGISHDGRTVTYHLRKNVKWHDGVPFTSKDVKFSWAAVMNNSNNVNSRYGYDQISSVDTPDDATVVFHLKRKFAPFVNTVFGESDQPYAVIPEHILGKLANVNTANFNQEPIGTGPFKVTKWVRGDHIELVANDNYFLGKPKLKSIFVKIIPDENTSVNALRTHDIDWMFEASPTLYTQIKAIPDTKVVLVQQNQFEAIDFNTSRSLLADARVRRAIGLVIDKAALVDKLTGGSATVATDDHPPFMWAHDPNIKNPATNLNAARALLASAGWKPGSDGVMMKNGQPLSVQMVYNVTNATRRQAAVQLQAMLKPLGVDVQVKTYQGSLLFAAYGMGGILQTGKFDISLHGWVAGIDPDNSNLYDCRTIPPHGSNYTRYCTPALDAAQDTALTNYDTPTRQKAYWSIASQINRDAPSIYLWWPRTVQPINPDFRGFAPNPVNEAWNAYEWEM